MADIKHSPAIVLCLLALAGCSVIPPQAYYNRGDPENLLDVSSEVVNLDLHSRDSLNQLALMISQDPPAHAELGCSPDATLCKQAKKMLDKHGIGTEWKSGSSDVTLVYERVVARDCENRYIDNSINPYNLPPPTFGCSLTGNMVQMVSDKRQFVSPNLLDFQDAEKSSQVFDAYSRPAAASNTPGNDANSPIVSIIK